MRLKTPLDGILARDAAIAFKNTCRGLQHLALGFFWLAAGSVFVVVALKLWEVKP